jgi:formylglycine-generating enzyme required for sulfatase activity
MLRLDHALSAAQRNQDLIGQAGIQKAIGDMQFIEGGLETAQAAYQLSLELYETALQGLVEPLESGSIYCKVGEIWQTCQNLDRAISSYRQAFEIYTSQGKRLEAAQIQLTIGQIQELAQTVEVALVSYAQAKALYVIQNNQAGVARTEALIARLQRNISLTSFEFSTVTVNSKGEVISQENNVARYFTEILPNQIPLELVAIPGGEFLMGSPEEEGNLLEKPQHSVTLASFFMGRYPITQAQWRASADLPLIKRALNPAPSSFKGDNHPVERVDWWDAVEFCDRLSTYTGLEYRLPSEAEWEYACRSRTQTPFYFGNTLTTKLANYNGKYAYKYDSKGKYRQKTTPIDHFDLANSFGLCDMHGNVYEWCQDHWNDDYKGAPKDGSAWLSENNNGSIAVSGRYFKIRA